MASLAGFDASQVPEPQEFGAMPAGQYVLIAVASEMKPTSAGTGQYLNVTHEVLDGTYKGRKVWSRFNLINPNETAVRIAKEELGALCRAVGVITPNDSSELHNKPFLGTLSVELDSKKKEKNEITKYEPIGGAQPAAQGQAPAFQQQAASPFTQQAQAQAQAAAPATAAATPPWKK